MIRKEFIGREQELSSLERILSRPGFEFMVITGRRRIGKTRLLTEFSRNRKNLSVMFENRKWEYNLNKLNIKIGEHFNIPRPNFGSFRDCIEFIVQRENSALIMMDEFSYLIQKNKWIIGEFQGIVDEILRDTDSTLIISGSSVSMMKKEVLGKGSPLYGRSTSNLVIQPLNFHDIMKWFDNASITDAVRIFGVCDGIPRYLEFFRGGDVLSEIEENFFNPDSFLFREPKFLLEEELREPSTYYQILEALSIGHTRVTDIANYSYMEPKDISSYLSTLIDLGFIMRETPITAISGKRSIYRIRDNMFKFWFRFTSPNFYEIENWNPESAVSDFRSNFDSYLGEVFEDICRGFVRDRMGYPDVGRWWHGEDEIDIVGVDRRNGRIIFGECKWTKKPMDRSEIFRLKEKAAQFRWRKGKRKEEFVLFSRSGFTDRSREIDGVNLIDLDMIKDIMGNGTP